MGQIKEMADLVRAVRPLVEGLLRCAVRAEGGIIITTPSVAAGPPGNAQPRPPGRQTHKFKCVLGLKAECRRRNLLDRVVESETTFCRLGRVVFTSLNSIRTSSRVPSKAGVWLLSELLAEIQIQRFDLTSDLRIRNILCVGVIDHIHDRLDGDKGRLLQIRSSVTAPRLESHLAGSEWDPFQQHHVAAIARRICGASRVPSFSLP
jgi:hypothetical protein